MQPPIENDHSDNDDADNNDDDDDDDDTDNSCDGSSVQIVASSAFSGIYIISLGCVRFSRACKPDGPASNSLETAKKCCFWGPEIYEAPKTLLYVCVRLYVSVCVCVRARLCGYISIQFAISNLIIKWCQRNNIQEIERERD